MAVTHINSVGASATGATTSATFPGEVSPGSLIVVCVNKTDASGSFAEIVAADLTKTGGTATIGAIALDKKSTARTYGAYRMQSAIFSFPVTAGGSLTMRIAGASAGGSCLISISEFLGEFRDALWTWATAEGNDSTGAPTTSAMNGSHSGVFVGMVSTGTTGATTHTVGVDYTQIYEEENGSSYATGSMEFRIVSAFTKDAADWVAPTTVPWTAAGVFYIEKRTWSQHN